MGIVFVLFFWFFVLAVLAAIYVILKFLAKKTKAAAALTDAFLALLGVGLVGVICLVVFTLGSVGLDYFYPSRIFTKNFGFEPTADVRITEGSSFWTPFGYSTHLKFQANENTIQKISANGFSELSRSYIKHDGSIEAEKILAQPQSHYYHKRKSIDDTNSTYLVYDEQSQTAYFSLQSDD